MMSDWDLENPSTLGLQLVVLLTEQIGGTLDIRRSNPTRFELRFPARNKGGNAWTRPVSSS